MMQAVRIARARESDRQGICRVHKASITILCGIHYTPQEIEALIFENSTHIGKGILIPDAYEIVMAASRKKADSTP